MRPELHFRAMGTTCSLFGDGDLVDGERWVRSFAARITRFDQSSELSHLNAAAAWVDISPELEQLLRASLRAFEMSGGLVNVAVLPSMIAIGSTRRRRWGDMHHVIDPRTGLPAASGLEEVSVAADTATAAEVIAKTALIAGPDLAPAYCATHAQAWWLS